MGTAVGSIIKFRLRPMDDRHTTGRVVYSGEPCPAEDAHELPGWLSPLERDEFAELVRRGKRPFDECSGLIVRVVDDKRVTAYHSPAAEHLLE